MTDDSDDTEAGDAPDAVDATDEASPPLEEVVAGVLRDVDAAHEDYERGYVDADATLSVVMSHVERLREAHEESM
ncbi:MAG: hypothetical protein ABEK02_08240 [Haloquadratum sp.]